MKVTLSTMRDNEQIVHPKSDLADPERVQLVLCFGSKERLIKCETYRMLREKYQHAEIVLNSTAGEIFDTVVYDDSLSITAIEFEHTAIQAVQVRESDFSNSTEAAKALMGKMKHEGLCFVFVIADGSLVNGSALVKGINDVMQGKVLVTGGLAGDGTAFHSTLVGLNEEPGEGRIVAIGFYGEKILVQHGSQGGWEGFGPQRKVTRSEHNVLFRVDDQPALELYKKYLGPDAERLPASALLFPLSVEQPESGESVVRTILSIDEASGSMTFAGDIPEGATVRFMKVNFDKLTMAASGAAQQTLGVSDKAPKLAILVSCVGRKEILKQRTEEELEAVDEVYNNKTILTGFYSYGELSPHNGRSGCRLHNQTMTITSIDETE